VRLEESGFPHVAHERRLRAAGRDVGDVDVALLLDRRLYLFECKYSILGANTHEFADIFLDVKDPLHQTPRPRLTDHACLEDAYSLRWACPPRWSPPHFLFGTTNDSRRLKDMSNMAQARSRTDAGGLIRFTLGRAKPIVHTPATSHVPRGLGGDAIFDRQWRISGKGERVQCCDGYL
jgi:hypothetical protein